MYIWPHYSGEIVYVSLLIGSTASKPKPLSALVSKVRLEVLSSTRRMAKLKCSWEGDLNTKKVYFKKGNAGWVSVRSEIKL